VSADARCVQAEDPDVCQGSIALEGPVIAQQLRKMRIGSETSQLFCTTFLGLCPYPPVDPSPLSLSPKPSRARPAPSGQSPVQIVHFSDIHVDPFYETGANTNCTKPICCRSFTPADAPGNNSAPAGPNGNHLCDAPVSLEKSMYAAIEAQFPCARFSIFTGDIVDHAVWNTTLPQNTIDINDAYSKMNASGMKLVYGTVGNHEMSPTNLYQPIENGPRSEWVYDVLAQDWTPWIGVNSAADVQKFGAYATSYPYADNLRIISINTNLFYIDNYYLYTEPFHTDPSGQWAWLVSQLTAAEEAEQRVYIIGHMPPGATDAFHDGSSYFDAIVNRYSATIAAMFWGHTHTDQFEVSYGNYTARSAAGAAAVSYVVPSLTPTSGMPAFRVYDVDPATWAVLDATTYAANMADPAFQTTGPVWARYYAAAEAYGPLVDPPLRAGAELSPAFWHNVTAALARNQSAFGEYFARKSRGWNVANCTGSCVADEICALQSGNAVFNCHQPSPGINLGKKRKRGVGGAKSEQHAHRDECGVTVTRSLLAGLLQSPEQLQAVAARLRARGAAD
jgi:sphingomyelin phosphodiesterase